jgi:hypothetical protein
MPEGWENFYFLMGTAAASLIGLTFVVATLTADMEERRAIRGMKLYMTPNVFHFGVVLVLSAMSTTHRLPPLALAVVASLSAAWGVIYMVTRLIGLRKSGATEDWTDLFFYGVAPVIVYVALGVAAWSIEFAAGLGPELLAGLMMTLLLLGIRNAWDLVSWMAPRVNRAAPAAIGDDAPAKQSDGSQG